MAEHNDEAVGQLAGSRSRVRRSKPEPVADVRDPSDRYAEAEALLMALYDAAPKRVKSALVMSYARALAVVQEARIRAGGV